MEDNKEYTSSCAKGIQVCSNERSHSFTKGDKKNRENTYSHVYKFSSPEPKSQYFNIAWHKASFGEGN